MDASRSTGPAAVVLAGGASRRMGGRDKTTLEVGGRALLDRVLDALPADAPVVVVGPERPVRRPVTWVREQPPGGGPVAALVTGLRAVDRPVVAVLAADLPFLSPTAVGALLAALEGHDGAVLVDADARPQLLAGCWRTEALRAAAARLPAVTGASVRALVGGLSVAPVRLPDGAAPAWLDCDTPADLARAKERA